jgi:type III restriction enzyme
MDTYGVPAVNNLRTLSRWAFVELTEIDQIDADFKAKVDREFDAMLARVSGVSPKVST